MHNCLAAALSTGCCVVFCYCVTKIGVSRLAGLQAAIAASDPRGGILVNAVSLTKMVTFDFHIIIA